MSDVTGQSIVNRLFIWLILGTDYIEDWLRFIDILRDDSQSTNSRLWQIYLDTRSRLIHLSHIWLLLIGFGYVGWLPYLTPTVIVNGVQSSIIKLTSSDWWVLGHIDSLQWNLTPTVNSKPSPKYLHRILPMCHWYSPYSPDVSLIFTVFSRCVTNIHRILPICHWYSPYSPNVSLIYTVFSLCATDIRRILPMCH